ncbi:MAG: conserved membrane protein of unknown function [Promethearchaeota archaeon]|nr:MAG: conserved membrane protein of unknown function [Candidatus Lokiarchaeota archaeon]
MSSEQEKKNLAQEPKKKEIEKVNLREYSKVIFFYPLFVTSLVLFILQLMAGDPIAIYGFVWMIVFAVNLFVVAFNFSSKKFFILVLIIIIAVLLFIFLIVPNFQLDWIPMPKEFNIEMTTQFYLIVTGIIGFILLFIIISTRFDYWVIEQNEFYHKQGLFVEANRYPTQNLRIKKEIVDVFEFIALASGSITLHTSKGEDFHLSNIPNVNAKIKKLNKLLSEFEVEIQDMS